MRRSASYSAGSPAATRAILSGFALVAVLLLAFAGPGQASAATLQPCQATQPTGPIINKDGELTLVAGSASRKLLRQAGVRQQLVRPANALTGRPTFPVTSVKYGSTSKIGLKGGITYIRGARKVTLGKLMAVVPDAKRRALLLQVRVGKRTVNFLQVRGGKRVRKKKSGKLWASGPARLTGAGAKLLNQRLRPATRFRAGTPWGRFGLFSLYTVTPVDDPTAEIPEVPPVKVEPGNAYAIESATTVKWFVRDTFINYVSTGDGTRVEGGATADAPSGPSNLSYSFNFPFSSGWTVPNGGEEPENTLIKGTGLVGFRYCRNTINFTVADPEIELDGDENSRLIFHVNGTDGTAFPDQRAVMVKLVPGNAQSRTVQDNGDGTKTVTYVKIPGYIPAEATGIFAGFYSAFDTAFVTQPQPACGGVPCTEENRPDRFGSFSITYTYRIPT